MLLLVEKVSRGGICHAIYPYLEANNKYMKNYNKNKESFFFYNIIYTRHDRQYKAKK